MVIKYFLLAKAYISSKPNLPGASQYKEEEHPRKPPGPEGGEWADKPGGKKEITKAPANTRKEKMLKLKSYIKSYAENSKGNHVAIVYGIPREDFMKFYNEGWIKKDSANRFWYINPKVASELSISLGIVTPQGKVGYKKPSERIPSKLSETKLNSDQKQAIEFMEESEKINHFISYGREKTKSYQQIKDKLLDKSLLIKYRSDLDDLVIKYNINNIDFQEIPQKYQIKDLTDAQWYWWSFRDARDSIALTMSMMGDAFPFNKISFYLDTHENYRHSKRFYKDSFNLPMAHYRPDQKAIYLFKPQHINKSLFHEIGHFIDHYMDNFASNATFASDDYNSEIGQFIIDLKKSKEYKQLVEHHKKLKNFDIVNYLTKDHELFSHYFADYMVRKTVKKLKDNKVSDKILNKIDDTPLRKADYDNIIANAINDTMNRTLPELMPVDKLEYFDKKLEKILKTKKLIKSLINIRGLNNAYAW